jgi:hypothetical protein
VVTEAKDQVRAYLRDRGTPKSVEGWTNREVIRMLKLSVEQLDELARLADWPVRCIENSWAAKDAFVLRVLADLATRGVPKLVLGLVWYELDHLVDATDDLRALADDDEWVVFVPPDLASAEAVMASSREPLMLGSPCVHPCEGFVDYDLGRAARDVLGAIDGWWAKHTQLQRPEWM